MHFKCINATKKLIVSIALKLIIKITLIKAHEYEPVRPDLVCDLLMVSGLILGADGRLPYCSCNLCS